MVIHRPFAFRLCPNTEQQQTRPSRFGCSRFVNIYFLRKRIDRLRRAQRRKEASNFFAVGGKAGFAKLKHRQNNQAFRVHNTSRSASAGAG
jgi:transposase